MRRSRRIPLVLGALAVGGAACAVGITHGAASLCLSIDAPQALAPAPGLDAGAGQSGPGDGGEAGPALAWLDGGPEAGLDAAAEAAGDGTGSGRRAARRPRRGSRASGRGSGPRVVEREEIEHVLRHPAELRGASAQLQRGDGEVTGYRLANIRAGSPLHDIGLRTGDVLLSVNGQRIRDADSALSAFGRFQAGTTTTVRAVLLRGGRRVVLRYRIE